jgi:hypothetical protein
MPSGLDSFLSIVIPTGIIIFIGVKIYGKMSEDHPGWFTKFKEWLTEKTAPFKTKLDPMKQGQIQYAP